ncbi:replicative DNA helicase [candidate division WWE3 bacterium CG09_land_8_20_14_0_10_39_24]|uniref:Replicative DNA helicase n=1 Tax=candidate division WWE3 bacterium CG09_land_8_20_14_0_10_39_24 TaxID=1975088 RepID=A0A2H0WJF2_UNCKA|nr:MAG: replicative DNA helicase [bacterium CG2_30_40_12]OJI08748.1 MAG: replicative DNA helicase [bacterium CG09_39_24]PIS12777.1 MAG: replicative DNA helicase [candidate division WWE3 bacterium CG09_land_8_20_14_0_10_39_24]PJE51655.1 MAG: replicative DNA helicase [candidate division WWE3 bacterium CG10_big_fil_rev_8_21_14_0_10_39_14]
MEIKLPPNSIEAEKSVLGAVLIDSDAIVKIAEFLRPEHFYKDSHKSIFEAILSLYEKREPIDLVTVPNVLKKKKVLADVGGISYLSELASFMPTSANIETYGRMIKDNFIRRQLVVVSGKIGELGFLEEWDVNELLDKAEQELYSISQDYLKQEFEPLKKVLERSFDRLEDLHKHKGMLRGVPTGLKSLDAKLNGLQDSNLIILAARPSVGKSSLAANIAQFAAVKHKMPVAMFSLEMSSEQLSDRMLAAQAGVDVFKITTGNLSDDDFAKLGEAMGILAEAPIYIDDTPSISVMEMRTKSRRLKLDKGIRLVVVDYLQLMRGRNLENRVQEVSEISQALKGLARELNVPVLALSQLSRAVEQRGGEKRPQLSDLRESGALEQDADVVMFLHIPDEEQRSLLKLVIAKHRSGPTGELELFFHGGQTKFYEQDTKRS